MKARINLNNTKKEVNKKSFNCYYYGIYCYNKVGRRASICPLYHVKEVFERLRQPEDYKKTFWNQVEKEIIN